MIPKSIKQHITKLHQKKFRHEFAEFLVEGVKGVEQAFNANADVIMLVVEGSKRDEADFITLVEKAEAKDIDVVFAAREDVGEIKTTDTFPGIMAIVSQNMTEADDIMDGNPVICLDAINDPGNLGTIIRTADWFGIKHILLGEGSVDPYNEKSVRSTMGSIFSMNVVKVKQLAETLSVYIDNGYEIVTFEMNGTDYRELPKKPKTVYVFGSESHGVQAAVSDQGSAYTIPSHGGAESLNVAMAAGIVMSSLK